MSPHEKRCFKCLLFDEKYRMRVYCISLVTYSIDQSRQTDAGKMKVHSASQIEVMRLCLCESVEGMQCI